MALLNEVKKLLKERFEKKTKWAAREENVKDEFYTKEPADNLFTKKIPDHLNKREERRIGAIHSSAALTFNIFGEENKTVRYNKKNYSLEYEAELETLIGTSKAKLDAKIETKGEIIFFEVKMTEWFSASKIKVAEAYKEIKKYGLDKNESTEFIKLFRAIDKKGEKPIVYDMYQMAKHLLGIYKFAREEENQGKRIRLINCVWEVEDPGLLPDREKKRYEKLEMQMEDEYKEFIKIATPIIDLIKKKTNFKLEKLTFKTIYNQIIPINEAQKKRLEMYRIKNQAVL